MKAKYKHTNIISKDWERLAKFYVDVFGCVRIPPERHLSGLWLERGTGVNGAQLSGVHLALPGYEGRGPTLEIYQYSQSEDKSSPLANREGFGHIAFEVEGVPTALDIVQQHGGDAIGEVVSKEIVGVGILTFVYAADPEGNIVELQSWK